ncbi:SET domain-containing protein 3 [Coemansia sp. RSA 1813]|nr:SET domain-containing protein 3 [Coemansia sp. RSA 1646]KAJ1771920.1 SET domain-containing protein 3 [Coemansia sp. RSA 1843]KAJ2087383.1 SET domain-containing protein 3 [Coemansia sp. RSA 986]KAJ2212254.1 SET domain-containing protein 3 [Coemansia sp. RSA 487]KAJ2566450.1 SET domain-containing protein 3 [Coemansia sp. RSA 1813]
MLPSNHSSTRDPREDSTPDEDQGLIRCICNIDDDDGFTIQCENCLVWQHAVCVGVEQDNVPDEYLCEKCNPRKLDIKRAVEYQRRRIDSEYRNSKEPRKRQKNSTSKPKRADESNDRKKRASDTKQPRSKSAKSAGSGRDSSSPAASRTADKGRDNTPLADSSYTPIDSNIFGVDVQVMFQSVLGQLAEQRNAVSAAAASVTSTPPASLTASSATKNGAVEAASLPTNELNSDSGKKQADDTLSGTPLPNGRSNSHLPHLPSTAAVDDGADPHLPSMVPMTDEDINSPIPIYKALVGKERCQTGLFSSRRIEGHRYVCEYKGQVLLKAAYKEDPKNYYELLRTTRPYSHFHPEIDICVDARRQGSEVRFIRRSCSPNVCLKSVFVPDNASPLIYLGLFAQRDVEPDEELTLSWEWEDGELPALARMSPSEAEDYLGRPEGRRLSKVWRQAFAGVSCACPDSLCEVRRLFALLNVEELPTKPDISGPLKRRASRVTRLDTNGADVDDQDPPSPSSSNMQSSDDHKPARNSHSRKGSAASGVGNDRTIREASDDVEKNGNASQDRLSIRSGSQLRRSLSSRNTSANASQNSEALHFYVNHNGNSNNGDSMLDGAGDNETEDFNDRLSENPTSRSASNSHHTNATVAELAPGRNSDSDSGSGELHPRKRKPSAQPVGDPSTLTDLETRNISNGNSSKKHRPSISSVASKNASQSIALPLKKLWVKKYLEECSEPRIISKDGENMTIVENPPSHSANLAVTQPALAPGREDSASRHSSVHEELEEQNGRDLGIVVNASAATEPPADNTVESGQNIIKSEPTDADAPTPPPTTSPPASLALERDTSAAQVSVTNAADGSKPALSAVDNDGSAQTKPQVEPEMPAKTAETKPDEVQKTSVPAAEQANKPPPKKQRLSLQEYNKRRRVNTPSVGSKEAESKDTSTVNTPLALQSEEPTPESASASAVPEEPSQTTDLPAVKAGVTADKQTHRRISGGSGISRNAISRIGDDVLPAPVPVRPVSIAHSETVAPGRGSTTPPLPSALFAPTESMLTNGKEITSNQQRFSRSPSLALGTPSAPLKMAGSPARRSLSSSLPPQPPPPPPPPPPSMPPAPAQTSSLESGSGGVSSGAGRGDERPRSSTGYTNSTRFERSGTSAYDAFERDRDRVQPGSVYRPRERDYGYRDSGNSERESGEIAHRRERMRSRSRGRGDRDRERRHNTFGGTSSAQHYHGSHYHQPPIGDGMPPPPGPPRSLTPHSSEGGRGSQRGFSDWRPGSGYSSQRMSPSPSFYGSGPTASSRTQSQQQQQPPPPPPPHVQQPGGSTGSVGVSRRTGIGTGGSRGGSPLRK